MVMHKNPTRNVNLILTNSFIQSRAEFCNIIMTITLLYVNYYYYIS